MNDEIIKLPLQKTEIKIDGVWLSKRDQLILKAEQLKILTSEDDVTAGDLIAEITTHSNKLEKFRKEIAKPFLDASKKIKTLSDSSRSRLEEMKSKLQKSLSDYRIEQKRIEQEKLRKAEEEEQKRIEKELAEHQEKIDAGIISEESEPEIKEKVFIPAIPVKPKSKAVIEKKVIQWRIVDEKKIPEFFKSFDSKKVNEYIEAYKEDISEKIKKEKGDLIIPGLSLTIATKIISKGRF